VRNWERICSAALKGQSGFEHLKVVTIVPRQSVGGGANSRLTIHPRVGAAGLRSARDIIAALQAGYELTTEKPAQPQPRRSPTAQKERPPQTAAFP